MLVILLIAWIAAVWTSSQRREAAPARPVSLARSAYLKLGPFEWERRNNVNYIVGVVTNTSEEEIGFAQVWFTLHDKAGAQVGTATDAIQKLEARAVWRFRCGVLEEDAQTARFKEFQAR